MAGPSFRVELHPGYRWQGRALGVSAVHVTGLSGPADREHAGRSRSWFHAVTVTVAGEHVTERFAGPHAHARARARLAYLGSVFFPQLGRATS